MVTGDGIARLTPREREILRAVCAHGREEAADLLFITPRSVKGALGRIYRRLGLPRTRSMAHIGRACWMLCEDDKEGGRA